MLTKRHPSKCRKHVGTEGATDDADLQAILAHNRDEEKEHAAMVLEWLRRHDAALSDHLQTYLFRDGSIPTLEAAGSTVPAAPELVTDGSLGIGSLRGDAG